MPARKRTGPKRDDKAVKIARDLATKAGLIAETRGLSIAEYLSDLLRPLINRDWPKALQAVEHGRQDTD